MGDEGTTIEQRWMGCIAHLFDRCPDGGPKRAVMEVAASGVVETVSIKRNQFILRRT